MSWLISRALANAYTNSHSSQAQAEVSLVATSLDGALYVPSSATPSQQVFSLPVKTTDVCRRFPSGMTYGRLTEGPGEAVLTWCLEVSHVRTLALQGSVPVSPAPDQGFGKKWQGLLVKYDLTTSSWRTLPTSYFEVSTPFSGTWPHWGMMRAGVCSEQPTPKRRTNETASGSWPTPRKCAAMSAKITPTTAWAEGRFPNLETVLGRRTWPTPTASDATGGPGHCGQGGENLRTALHNSERGGLMNPRWVEWLMGWPIGWAALKPLETGRFQQWCALHGVACDRER